MKGAIFSKEGQALFPFDDDWQWPILAFLNSYLAQFSLNLYCGQHKYGSYVGQLPIAPELLNNSSPLGDIAKQMFALKSDWDLGNEVNHSFVAPWLLRQLGGDDTLHAANAIHPQVNLLPSLVNLALKAEDEINEKLGSLQAEIEETLYSLYSIPNVDQIQIQKLLSRRPAIVVWPHAEGLTSKQKASEHVARLISYLLLQIIRNDSDGIIPLTEGTGHSTVLDGIQNSLERQFGESTAYQFESDAAAYLGRALSEWLVKIFWKDYHLKWYKNRPILWQLCSPKGNFSCFIYIHKLTRETLPRVRTQYLWSVRNAYQSGLESARQDEATGQAGAARRVEKIEAVLDDLANFEKSLVDVIEGRVKCEFPDWAEGPYRNGAYDPVQDDGVAINILPLQNAGLLAKTKVV